MREAGLHRTLAGIRGRFAFVPGDGRKICKVLLNDEKMLHHRRRRREPLLVDKISLLEWDLERGQWT